MTTNHMACRQLAATLLQKRYRQLVASLLQKRCAYTNPPKDGEIALWSSTNGAIPYFLVLPGSELSITEITEYTYFVH